MGKHLERARILFRQQRYDLAERELRDELAAKPECATSHAFLAHCLEVQRKGLTEAEQEATEGIRLAPALGYAHYVLGRVFQAQQRGMDAEASLREALRLEPQNPDYYQFLSWSQHNGGYTRPQLNRLALETAERGLQCDPAHVGCMNSRALALMALDRPAEASAAINAALALDPECGMTWMNHGWIELQQQRADKALQCYLEALRLRPGSKEAGVGLDRATRLLWEQRMGRVINALWAVVCLLGIFVAPLVWSCDVAQWDTASQRGLFAFGAICFIFGLPVVGLGFLRFCLSPGRWRLVQRTDVQRTVLLAALYLVIAAATVLATCLAGTLVQVFWCTAALAPLTIPLTVTAAVPAGDLVWTRQFLAKVTGVLAMVGLVGAGFALQGSRGSPVVVAIIPFLIVCLLIPKAVADVKKTN